MAETFLDGRVVLHCGDSRDVLKTIPDCSIDSIVTDPPYALVSIVKRFGAGNAAAVKVPEGGSGAYARASAGFLGKAWDTGETAFATDFWAECLRVLKPGGHVVAFSGTRTYHRMACAIEDAGFEVRDMLSWLYGSGFPKSHNVGKGLDKHGGVPVAWFGPWLKAWREENNIKQSDVAALFPSRTGGKTGCVANWEIGLNMPTPDQFNLICKTYSLPFESLAEAEREIVGRVDGTRLAVAPGQGEDRSARSLDITAAASAAAQTWEGWGTALKPACEPICFGRKPMRGTVASNVLEHGTGAINIDGCRVGTADDLNGGGYGGSARHDGVENWRMRNGGAGQYEQPSGRWPANIILDGSEEVLAAFPETTSGLFKGERSSDKFRSTYGTFKGTAAGETETYGDTGSAARFFYTAKADADDRLGSKHPTVKPVDLMQWLCRLVTPKGGTVLDPFAGTGTTGEAAFREGFNAVLIEREPEYQNDIRRRMALCLAGPEERKRESIKAKLGDVPFEPGSLFAGIEAAE
jgi:DNA modification methylase